MFHETRTLGFHAERPPLERGAASSSLETTWARRGHIWSAAFKGIIGRLVSMFHEIRSTGFHRALLAGGEDWERDLATRVLHVTALNCPCVRDPQLGHVGLIELTYRRFIAGYLTYLSGTPPRRGSRAPFLDGPGHPRALAGPLHAASPRPGHLPAPAQPLVIAVRRSRLAQAQPRPGTALPSAAVSTHAERLLVPSPSLSLAEATRPTCSAARKPGLFFLGFCSSVDSSGLAPAKGVARNMRSGGQSRSRVMLRFSD